MKNINKKTNKLFILLTDNCMLNCDFCSFKENVSKDCLPLKSNWIDLNRGFARNSLSNLINDSEIIGFSGGGEPLIHIKALLDIILLARKKRFILTTNGSFEEKRLFKMICDIDSACKTSSSSCVIRLSFDVQHVSNNNYHDNLDSLIKWFLENTWDNCSHLFFRSNIVDEEFVIKRLKKSCNDNSWTFDWKNLNELTKKAIINNKEFTVIFRPIINPSNIGIIDKYSIYEYINILSKTDSNQLTLGIPKGCHGCHGCKGLGVPICGSEAGLDITIDTKGNVYLYGIEISILGSIYDDQLSYEFLKQKIEKEPIYEILRNKNVKDIFVHLSKDEEFKKHINEVNYPYKVISNLNKINASKLSNMILELNK